MLRRSCSNARQWLRLLYDDGFTLEQIVEQAFTMIGASVRQTSKEKDDYRLEVDGYPQAVMEVKGTHNPKFGVGALRRLANWMDEAIAQEGNNVKGIFVGNAGLTQSPATREAHLFEENNEKFAMLRDIAILRAMDLYCLVLLKIMDQLDQSSFWQKLFESKGQFDAQKYWPALGPEFQIADDDRKQ